MKFLSGIGVVFILFVMVVGCESSTSSSDIFSKPPFASITDSINKFPDRADLHLSRALRLSQANLHEQATPDYKKAWEIAQEEVTCLEYAANLILINKVAEAVEFLKRSKQQFPGNNEITRRLSELYAQSGRRKEALDEYDSILGNDSTNFLAWYEKGVLLSKLRDTSEAIVCLKKSYTLQPTIYTGLALANIFANQPNEEVISLCDDMLQRDTTGVNVDALFLKGVYYSETNQYPKALEVFENCIKADWKFADAHIEKGIVYFVQKDFTKALESFKISATVENTNADAYYWMGRSYEQLNDKEQAIENYERALSFDPRIQEAVEGMKRLR